MPKNQIEVNIANGIAIDNVNNVLLILWMEVYPDRFNQSESLLHT